MSSIEKILGEIRDRANVLREHIDRGRYDGKQPQFQDKMQEFLDDGAKKIRKFYKKKHGMLYTIKSKKDEKRDITRLYEIVKSHEDDLTNRLNLLNYYSRQNIQDPNNCKNMSQEKCSRGENIRNCLWVPGSDEYGEWTPDPWNERKQGGKLPEYVGTNLHQRPRGCYPVKQNTDFDNAERMGSSALLDRGRQVLSTLPVQEKQLTPSQMAEAEVKVKPLTAEQKQKRQQRKEANRKQYADMLAKLKAKTPANGGRKTRKRKRRKRKTKKRLKGGDMSDWIKKRVDEQEEKKRRILFGRMKLARRQNNKEEIEKIKAQLKKSFERQEWYGTQGAKKNLDVLAGMQVQKAMPEIEKSMKMGLLVPRKTREKRAGRRTRKRKRRKRRKRKTHRRRKR